MDRLAFLKAIEADRDQHVALLQKFIQAPSPNPPGDTGEAAQVLITYLNEHGVETEIVAPQGPERPNVVSEFEVTVADGDDGSGSKHDDEQVRVIMNGHLDVFPVDETRSDRWSHGGPWSGHCDGRYVFGRGGVDMKAGTAASAIAFAYLNRHRRHLGRRRGAAAAAAAAAVGNQPARPKASVALTLVSDEETGGKFGSRYLLETDPKWRGTVMINAEPGGLQSIRFGEKGTLRMTFTVVTRGVHGAYTHLSEGANRIAARLIERLLTLEDMETNLDRQIVEHMARPEVRRTVDSIMGPGAADIVLRPTVNVGTLHGGIKVNMIPDRCAVEVDVRLPIGLTKGPVLARIDQIIDSPDFRDRTGKPTVSYHVQEAASNPPSHCSPTHEMVEALANAAQTVTSGHPEPLQPLAIPSLGATDTKFWRYHGVPAYVFGVSPETMAAGVDERVSVEEFLVVVRTHALAVWDYLGGE
jgi:acetylornithine deacetylase/succinyl-diaminopimelate desuccinylase-like protein